MQASTATTAAAPHKPFYTHLYAQVLTAIVFGVLLGYFYPQLGEQMKPLGDGFIKLIKMLIAPIIFCTVVHGIASMEDMKKVGRVGLKALIYFEGVTTLRPSIPSRFRSTRPRRASRAPSSFSCTSYPTRWSAPSPKAKFCRFYFSQSCSHLRCSCWASAASRSSTSLISSPIHYLTLSASS